MIINVNVWYIIMSHVNNVNVNVNVTMSRASASARARMQGSRSSKVERTSNVELKVKAKLPSLLTYLLITPLYFYFNFVLHLS